MKKLIAVTGGIGSGKSKVMEIIESLGFPTISCDEVTNKLYKKQSVLRKIKKIIPSGIKGNLFLNPTKSVLRTLFLTTKINTPSLLSF